MLFEFLYIDESRSGREKNEESSRSGLRRIKKLLGSVEHLGRPVEKGDDTVFPYSDPHTGVEARFVAYQAEYTDEVGLAFEMDLPRPTYFAYEVLPVALCVAREARLGVEILRAEGSQHYSAPSFEELLQEWRMANLLGIEARRADLYQGSAPVLEAMWEYALVRSDLERRYGRQKVQVPELYPVLHRKTREIGRMVDWDGLQPIAFGEVDWIRLLDPAAPLKDGAIYEAEELITASKPLIRSVPQPVFHALFEKARQSEELVERIAGLKKLSMRSFQRLEPAQIYDDEGWPQAVL